MKAFRANLAALLAAALLIGAAPASAQDLSLGALVDRLERLERDIGLITRQLATAGVPESALTAGEGGVETAGHQEVRFGELEEQLRQLTGQVEEARFALRQIGDRVEGLAADTDARLAAIEQRLTEAPAPAPVADAVPPDTPPETTVVEGGDGVLGTVPAEGTDVALVTPPVDQPVADTYSQSIQLLSQTDYASAQAGFQAIIDAHPEDPLAGNAHFWIGEIFMKQGDHQNAAVAFARGYKAFPDGNKAADSLLKLGMAFAAMGKNREACATYERLMRELVSAPAHIADRLPVVRAEANCS